MEYSINGLSNVSYKYSKLTIPVELKHLSGPQESVNLSLSGLPSGMKFNLSTTAGTPSFGTFLELTHTATLTKGTYPVKFTAITTSGKSKSIDFNLAIDGSCADEMTGNYIETIIGTSYKFNTVVATKVGFPNRLYFYDDGDETSYADLDCGTGKLKIPFTTTDDGFYTYEGEGVFTISPKSMTIVYTIRNASDGTISEIRNSEFKTN